ncbi:hypothetical protein HEP_00002400 [Hepatocystis sp. ex Piliocolobus tephrosceles]|nr:hypothetical protein HEP_00002400 [Hepatocystis sp. ex Piliocolobus tephrosceles]
MTLSVFFILFVFLLGCCTHSDSARNCFVIGALTRIQVKMKLEPINDMWKIFLSLVRLLESSFAQDVREGLISLYLAKALIRDILIESELTYQSFLSREVLELNVKSKQYIEGFLLKYGVDERSPLFTIGTAALLIVKEYDRIASQYAYIYLDERKEWLKKRPHLATEDDFLD